MPRLSFDIVVWPAAIHNEASVKPGRGQVNASNTRPE